jgi:nicotinamide riboside transporter PnuC
MDNQEIGIKKPFWGKISVVVAFVAMILMFVPSINNAINPPPPVPLETVVDTAKKVVKMWKSDSPLNSVKPKSDSALAKVASDKVNREVISKIGKIGSLALVAIAFCLAMVSFLNHESKRFMQVTVATSIIVVGYNFWLVAMCLAVFSIVMFSFSNLFSGSSLLD